MLQFFDGEKKFYRTVGTRVDIKDNDNKNDNDKTRKLGEIVIVSYNHKTSYTELNVEILLMK